MFGLINRQYVRFNKVRNGRYLRFYKVRTRRYIRINIVRSRRYFRILKKEIVGMFCFTK